MKDFLDKHPKLKNPYFWLSIVGLLFASAGIDFNTLTSWQLLGEALISILNNPISEKKKKKTLVGIWNDNRTKRLDGLKDKEGDK